MAFVWRGWRECFRWAPLVFLLIVTPGALAAVSDADYVPGAPEMSLATIAPASTISCEDIHGDSFGNQTAKPGVCYLVADVKGDFHDARAYCQALNDSLGWDVADIEDAVENMLIQDALTTLKENGSLSSATTFWVGQNDLETEDTWAYLNDSSNSCNRSVYLNWRYQQPNGGRRQNCIAYFYNENGNFQDRKCDDDYYYLCKVKVTSDTVPSCPDFVEDTSTEAPDACLDIWPVAFSNPAVPGVCYAHESYQQFYFEDALNFCNNLPGGSWSVVDIEDAEENLFLEAWNRDNFPKNNGYWIGQNDREQEADWRYTSSGQCPVYLNWRYDQPNGGREQNCIVMFKTDDGAFQDKACNERRYYSLCKLKTDPGPTPNPEFINCNGSTLPSEVAECTSLKSGAFGSVDNPGYCYYMSGNQMTWEQAVQNCQAHGWELIDIENALENEILAARFRDFWPTKRYYWVGQNDRATEGIWQYSSNSTPVTVDGVYLNWEDGQPNDEDSTQNCIMMDKTGQWQDKSCTGYYYVTCKKRVGQIPTATAAWTDHTTEQPTTKATTRQQTTEGATTEQPLDTTEQPTTEATSPQQTTEGATTEQPTDSSPITGSGRFVFKSADATCSSATSLHTSSARDRFHCARKCQIQGNCRSFSFAASGEEDACELCSEVLDADNLQRKIGSVYYFESK